MAKKKMKAKTKKKGWKSNNEDGSLCSGYGVFPDGSKCKGCIDCGGKKVGMKGIIDVFHRNHFIGTIKQAQKLLGKAPSPDYAGFRKHLKAYDRRGISWGTQNLKRLAGMYGTPIPRKIGKELTFDK